MEKKPIYFDHAATTPLCKEAFEKMTPYFTEIFGNPNSQHAYGRESVKAVDEARDAIAKIINAKPNEVYFVGRSSITQGMRTIYADKIRMILKPKDFHAEGNTRTVIKNVGDSGSDDEEITLGL